MEEDKCTEERSKSELELVEDNVQYIKSALIQLKGLSSELLLLITKGSSLTTGNCVAEAERPQCETRLEEMSTTLYTDCKENLIVKIFQDLNAIKDMVR